MNFYEFLYRFKHLKRAVTLFETFKHINVSGQETRAVTLNCQALVKVQDQVQAPISTDPQVE